MLYLEDLPGRETEIEGISYLFFSGFAYLGMPSLKEFQHVVQEGVSKFGTVFPSSRRSNTPHRLYVDFEKALSQWVDLPATASFSSGYLAALSAVHWVADQKVVYAIQGTHPSLCQGNKIRLLKNKEWIVDAVNSSEKDCAVVLETVNPLTGALADFDWLLEIKKPVSVVVDDSHGIGILGAKGEGIKPYLPRGKYLKYLLCYSLSKAFSCEGGAVSGEEDDILELRSQPTFSASTPMSPAYAYAWMKSRTLFLRQCRLLHKRVRFFNDMAIHKKNITFDGRLPVCFITRKDIYKRALEHHIILSAFRYPTQKDPLITRAVINALHTEEDLKQLLHCIMGN